MIRRASKHMATGRYPEILNSVTAVAMRIRRYRNSQNELNRVKHLTAAQIRWGYDATDGKKYPRPTNKQPPDIPILDSRTFIWDLSIRGLITNERLDAFEKKWGRRVE